MSSAPPKTVETTRGYGVLKSSMTPKELALIKKELTVRPFVPPGAPVKPTPFPVFAESPLRIWIPRAWDREHFGLPVECRVSPGEDRREGLRFPGDLREHQKTLLKDWAKVVASPHPEGRILTVPCGYGKTVMSLWCAAQVGRKTMVVVHKEFLMNQFRDEIHRFLPGAKIGKIQGDTVDVEDRDIVLVMLQSLIARDYPPSVFEGFGMVIFDECHHLAAEVFSRTLLMLGFWRILGLSATPNRKDNLSNVFHWHIGGFLAKVEERKKETVKIWCLRHRVPTRDEAYLEEPKMMNDHVSLPKLITRVTDRGDRTAILLELIKQFVRREERRVLVLSDRKSQLKWFYETLKAIPEFTDDVGYYIGGMKQKDLEISATKHVVLGTFAMASEGMNIPALDTLVMASPKSDIVQSVGRILRKRAEDRHVVPLVVDVVDPHPSLIRQFKRRKAVYRKYEYDIVEGEWDAKAREFKTLKEIKAGGGGGGGEMGGVADDGSDDESWSSSSGEESVKGKNPRKTKGDEMCLLMD
jgi:superfamily II DNA or RNA helicase